MSRRVWLGFGSLPQDPHPFCDGAARGWGTRVSGTARGWGTRGSLLGLLDGADDTDREEEDGGDQGENACDRDADDAKGQENEPEERVKREGEQGEGPAGEQKNAEEEKLDHDRLRSGSRPR